MSLEAKSNQRGEKVPFIPKYKRLTNLYREAILAHEYGPGARLDSINEIQSRHGVSRETAKLVLKTLCDEGLIVQKAGMGSFVADLRPPRKLWGVVLPFYSVHYDYLLGHLSRRAWAKGREFRHFVDYNNWEEEVRLVGRLINERYEAVIIIPTLDESKTASFYSRLKTSSTVVSLLDHTMAGSFFPYVVQSYDLGVERGMRYLLQTTNRSIAFVRNEIWADRNLVQEMMEEAYLDHMRTRRPDVEPIVVEHAGRVDREFVQTRGIEGFFSCDDTDAVGIIGRLKEQGLSIPLHARLVSYGNTEIARYFTPAITSIDPRTEEMVRQTIDIVMTRIGGGDIGFSQYVVQPELIHRET